jgi:hypothetical protein
MELTVTNPTVWTATVTDNGQQITLIALGSQGPPGPPGEDGLTGGDVPAPIFPIIDVKVASAVAAGASANLDSVIVANAKIGKIQQITLSSSAAYKWEIQSMTAGTPTSWDVIFTAGVSGNTPTHEWEPPHRDYTDLAGNGTNTFFRVVATNLDARNPANAYATFYFDEVDP